jgi:hypothetical protein
MRSGVSLGRAVRALLGGGDPGALPSGGSIQVLHGAGEKMEVELSASQRSVHMHCQGAPPPAGNDGEPASGVLPWCALPRRCMCVRPSSAELLAKLGAEAGDTLVLKRDEDAAGQPAISLAVRKRGAPAGAAAPAPQAPAAPAQRSSLPALSGNSGATAAGMQLQQPQPAQRTAPPPQAEQLQLQPQAPMTPADLPTDVIDRIRLVARTPEQLRVAHGVITAAAAGGAAHCRTAATALLRQLELGAVLQQAGVPAGDAVRCAQLHAQLSGSQTEADQASAARVHGMVVTEAWGGGGGGEGGAAAVREAVQSCLAFF